MAAARRHDSIKRSGTTPALLIAGAVGVLALPSAVLAFSSNFNERQASPAVDEHIGNFAPGTIDPRLARAIAARPTDEAGLFRFTPAGTATRPDRSVTVAVRVDPTMAQAITVRGVLPGRRPAPATLAEVHIAPTAYNLSVARNMQGFAPSLSASSDIRRIEMPDLSAYRAGNRTAATTTAAPAATGFSPHLSLDEQQKAGRAPRTFESLGEQTVDFGGSYRLSRNLDVTAGVRYSQERDRLAPLTDGKQDSRAVYVGTQFRF